MDWAKFNRLTALFFERRVLGIANSKKLAENKTVDKEEENE